MTLFRYRHFKQQTPSHYIITKLKIKGLKSSTRGHVYPVLRFLPGYLTSLVVALMLSSLNQGT